MEFSLVFSFYTERGALLGLNPEDNLEEGQLIYALRLCDRPTFSSNSWPTSIIEIENEPVANRSLVIVSGSFLFLLPFTCSVYGLLVFLWFGIW
jgi:hypothetical protein